MRRVLCTGLAALALSGCAQFNLIFHLPSDATPVVRVGKQQITAVDPDPLRFRKGDQNVRITWQLEWSSPYRFAPNGIVIDGELLPGKDAKPVPQTEIVECSANADRTQFSCVNKNTRPGTYKYTVRVVTVDGKALPPFDPSIVNGGAM